MRPSALFPTQRLARWQLALPLLLIALLMALTPLTQRVDLWLYDELITRAPLEPADDLLIIAVDERSLNALGQWPWPRRTHGELIRQLDAAGARTIAFDVLFTESSPEQADDRMLAQAMEAHGNVVLPLHLYPVSASHPLAEFLPIATLTQAAARLGHVHVELDEDGIARSFYRREGMGEAFWYSLADAVADAAGHDTPGIGEGQDADSSAFVNVRTHRVRIPFAPLDSGIETISYIDVLNGSVNPARLQDKVVFVGATAAGLGDVLPTPVSGRAHPMNGVEFHANAYSALVQDHLIRPLSAWPVAGMTLLSFVLIVWWLPRLAPGWTVALSLALAVAPIALSWLLLRVGAIWFPPASPALLALLALPLWTGQRLALLNRFLNRQLDALSREPRLRLDDHSHRAPLQILDHLSELLAPKNSWLISDDTVLRGELPGNRPVRKLLAEPGRWVHEDHLSVMRFYTRGCWHEMGFVWRPETDRNATLILLNGLDLHQSEPENPIRRSREKISERIEQIRDATDALAGMRRFIGEGLEQMPDGIIVTDGLGVIVFTNRHIADWFNQPRQSLETMPLIRLLNQGRTRESHPDMRETLTTLLQGRSASPVTLQVQGRDLLLHLVPFPLPESGQYGIVANVSDITEIQDQQRQYRDAIDFISHDVRSPLVSQLALLDQLRAQNEPVPVDVLDQAARLARRSYQLAEEFVQLARAEQLTETRFYECELLTITENAADAVAGQAMARQIDVLVNGEELWLKGNAELLERAIINLMTNAIQYSPPQSCISVTVTLDGDFGIVSITDQGPGIPREEQPWIFERFNRQPGTELAGPKGAGLGLTFVRTVADKHRGLVDVSSRSGEGSTFRLYLPATGHPAP